MDIVFWLWLLNAPGLGIKAFYNALKVFEAPKNVFEEQALSLKQSGIFSAKALAYLVNKDLSCVDKDLAWAKGDQCHIISLIDSDYPKLLAPISDPPAPALCFGQYQGSEQVPTGGSRQ